MHGLCSRVLMVREGQWVGDERQVGRCSRLELCLTNVQTIIFRPCEQHRDECSSGIQHAWG